MQSACAEILIHSLVISQVTDFPSLLDIEDAITRVNLAN